MVHHIVAVSNATRQEIVDAGVPGKRVSVVPDGIDRPRHGSVGKDAGSLNLLFVGTCYPRKGVEYLVDAIGQLRDNHIILNIVGKLDDDVRYTRRIYTMVENYGLREKIVFHDWLSGDALWTQYAKSDIFVLPSLWEGFGIVILEAMCFGIPIIATRAGAIPELIKDGWNGLLVEPGDSLSLSRAIARLVDNPVLRKTLGNNALASSRDALTWDQVGERFSKAMDAFVGTLHN